ncbi:MAG: hypothetical protein ABSH00_04400 [Bryobacteraceae bacterium]|jgi:hypothetical protein
MRPTDAQLPSNSQWLLIVVRWTAMAARTVKALVDFKTRSGMIIRECGYCESGENRWINATQRQGKEAYGEPEWVNLIEFVSDELKARFQHEALQAVDRYLEDIQHGF